MSKEQAGDVSIDSSMLDTPQPVVVDLEVTPAEGTRRDELTSWCLDILISMLERVNVVRLFAFLLYRILA